MSQSFAIQRGFYSIVSISYEQMACKLVPSGRVAITGLSCIVEHALDEHGPRTQKHLTLDPIPLVYYWKEAVNDEVRWRLSDRLDQEQRALPN